MFKYTPKNQIKKDMIRAGALTYVKNRNELDRIMQLARVVTYHDRVQFEKHYISTVYFSEKKLRNVPVGSAMINVSMFDVEEIWLIQNDY